MLNASSAKFRSRYLMRHVHDFQCTHSWWQQTNGRCGIVLLSYDQPYVGRFASMPSSVNWCICLVCLHAQMSCNLHVHITTTARKHVAYDVEMQLQCCVFVAVGSQPASQPTSQALHTYIHTYICTYIHMYIHTYRHMYIRTLAYVHRYIHTYTHTYVHT